MLVQKHLAVLAHKGVRQYSLDPLGAVDACQVLSVTVAVTMHDGWWENLP
jgi:hypothetical protein